MGKWFSHGILFADMNGIWTLSKIAKKFTLLTKRLCRHHVKIVKMKNQVIVLQVQVRFLKFGIKLSNIISKKFEILPTCVIPVET